MHTFVLLSLLLWSTATDGGLAQDSTHALGQQTDFLIVIDGSWGYMELLLNALLSLYRMDPAYLNNVLVHAHDEAVARFMTQVCTAVCAALQLSTALP